MYKNIQNKETLERQKNSNVRTCFTCKGGITLLIQPDSTEFTGGVTTRRLLRALDIRISGSGGTLVLKETYTHFRGFFDWVVLSMARSEIRPIRHITTSWWCQHKLFFISSGINSQLTQKYFNGPLTYLEQVIQLQEVWRLVVNDVLEYFLVVRNVLGSNHRTDTKGTECIPYT